MEMPLDAIIVGAGFAGLYMLTKLRSRGFRCQIVEAADDVGGTWYWNRYPGSRCDIESVLYSYSFSPELEKDWQWTERFAAQPEILRYLQHVADRFDLRRDIVFGTTVQRAQFDASRSLWTIEGTNGFEASARFLITAVGAHSARIAPNVASLDTFAGELLFTGAWPREPVALNGKRVGVIGTGSSGIQVITALAPQVQRLSVLQRTPNFSLPARNATLSPAKLESFRSSNPDIRDLARRSLVSGGGDAMVSADERKALGIVVTDLPLGERTRLFERAWATGGFIVLRILSDVFKDEDTNTAIADFVRSKIGEIVKASHVAELLKPKGYPIGAKRVCMDTGYYEVFNRPNVELFDIRTDPIECANEKGVLLSSGRQIDLDTLILATGFDMVTGPLLRLNIVGEGGRRLAEHWAEGPKSYLGLGVDGFPNFFSITGPLSPSAVSNVVVSIEQHVDWIADCMTHMAETNLSCIRVDPRAEAEWTRHVRDLAAQAVQSKTDSWYVGANVPGKPRAILVYTGGEARYREICDKVQEEGYRGYIFQ